MLCYYCEEQARAVCRFCGAAVCKTHVSATRFVSGYEYVYEGAPSVVSDYVAVANAIWCGRCAAQTVRNKTW